MRPAISGRALLARPRVRDRATVPDQVHDGHVEPLGGVQHEAVGRIRRRVDDHGRARYFEHRSVEALERLLELAQLPAKRSRARRAPEELGDVADAVDCELVVADRVHVERVEPAERAIRNFRPERARAKGLTALTEVVVGEPALPHVAQLPHRDEAADVAEQARHQRAPAAAAPADVQHLRAKGHQPRVTTGSFSQPRAVEVWAITARSVSTSQSGQRCNTSSSATRPSSRARAAPRQKCKP